MTPALETAATAFQETLHQLGFSGTEAELGDATALGRRGALLAVSNLVWRRRLGPLLDSHQVRILLNACTRQAISDFVKRHRLLALPDERGRLLFPSFQFSAEGRPVPHLAEIIALFVAAEVTPYTTASWFVTPQSALDGATPAEWLRSGQNVETVVEAARRATARLGQ
jgi:hypothetical protein